MRRKVTILALGLFMGAAIFTGNIMAQEEESSPVDLGMDIYSSYIWRGAKFGNGPAFQPWVEAAFGDFSIGAWGSVSSSDDEGFEMDLYAGYSIGPVGITVTDYYFGGDWMDFSENHYFEPMLSVELGSLSITAAYMLTSGSDAVAAVDAVPGTPASIDTSTWTITPAVDPMDAMPAVDEIKPGDIYFELGYSFENFDIAIGAGNNQYVAEEDDFTVCNITVGTSKEIGITETFSLPISGAVTLNPSTGGFFISVGVSF